MKIIFLLFVIISSGYARTVYITDEVDIPIRSDKSFSDNIVRSAPSGTALEILQTDNDGWTKIKLEDTEGWIISRYLSNNPPARDELARIKKSYNANKLILNRQKEQLNNLHTQLAALKIENKTNKDNALKAMSEKTHIEQTYIEALKIEHENQTLQAENLNLKTQIKMLNIGNETTIERTQRLWFIFGGILVIISMILGFVAAKLTRRK